MSTSRRTWRTDLLGTVLVLLSACSNSANPGDGSSTSAVIGSAGGSISHRGVTLEFPPGALGGDTRITITATTKVASAPYTAYSPIYRFEPESLIFSQRVTARFEFSGDAARARVFWSQSSGSGWDNLGGKQEGGKLVASVGHFSEAFAGDGPADTAAACPVPETGGDGGWAPGDKPQSKKDCPGCTGVPAGCATIKGGNSNAAWLQCWRDNSTDTCNIGELCFGTSLTCTLSDAVLNQIASLCKGEPTDLSKIACVSDKLRMVMHRPQEVCRHFGVCMDMIMDKPGINISSDYEVGYFSDGGHAWTEQKIDTDGDKVPDTMVISDPSNDIVFSCPMNAEPGPKCNGQGCCGASNKCQPGTAAPACGSGGDSCVACPSGQTCIKGACEPVSCNSSSCPNGCCDTSGTCQAGSNVYYCGSGGGACTACSSGQTCIAGACVSSKCNSSNCPSGCCDGQGTCQAGSNVNYCGSGGGACAACSTGQTCIGKACVSAKCNSSNCPSGCCDTSGVCQAGTAKTACGKGGGQCLDCPSGQVCTKGGCAPPSCGPANCIGCCDSSGKCLAGTVNGACGKGAASCTACPISQSCANGACSSKCNASNCSGCCDSFGNCLGGTTDASCGKSAGTCAACPMDQSCVSGVCTPKCTASNCSGCCNIIGTCLGGTTKDSCGKGGATCVSCVSGQSCSNGACAKTCNASNCSGCCNSVDVCDPGTAKYGCGQGGAQCVNCPSGQVCKNNACVPGQCNSSNCSGCCDSKDTCRPGTSSLWCGTGGADCSFCSLGKTCSNGACVSKDGGVDGGPTDGGVPYSVLPPQSPWRQRFAMRLSPHTPAELGVTWSWAPGWSPPVELGLVAPSGKADLLQVFARGRRGLARLGLTLIALRSGAQYRVRASRVGTQVLLELLQGRRVLARQAIPLARDEAILVRTRPSALGDRIQLELMGSEGPLFPIEGALASIAGRDR